MAVSILVHAGLLTVRFVDPAQLERLFQDTPLEVILVNSRTQEAPDKAQAIAQANLAGGGNVAHGRATSPLPSAAQARFGHMMQEEEQRVQAMQMQQNRLLAQLRQQLATLPVDAPEAIQPGASTPQLERRQALADALAEIEFRINEENARPRKRYISPATKEAVYAMYYDELRRRIESRGTENFPQAAGQKLYGELTMAITINHDGDVLDTEVIQSSGQIALDTRAQAIVRSVSFDDFNAGMRERADQIVVVSHFRFTRDETLRTRVSGS